MRVLVLCHGNINRSPFVAAVLRRERPGWEVRSAGLKVGTHGRAARRARAAAERRGLDLSGHWARPVTPEDVAWAEVILFMDGGNERRLRGLLPAGDGRALNLGGLCRVARVPDPNFMSDPDQVEAAFALAERCAVAFARRETHAD